MSLEVLSESRAGKVDCWDYAASNVDATCRFVFVELLLVGYG